MPSLTEKGSRGIFKWSRTPQDREEQGYPPSSTIGSVPEPGLRRTLTTTDVSTLVPSHDKLLIFRSLAGIDTVPALTADGHSVRTAPNIGIYTRVIIAEKKAASRYKIFHLLINTCLAVQVIFGAILTALGASKGSSRAVTAFGAINTIMAGILAYLKGSGLPNRLKYNEDEWKKLREHIEQREREFCLVDCPLDVREEIHIVEDMYERVKDQLEANNSHGMMKPSKSRSQQARNIASNVLGGEERT
ncbi:hypothetical protein B0J13DRAFT_599732 [Dactylonectria estremocensis]|uniref:SMODS and SLOG-associating 2TM effector domain-containing protein n=1 Tax=Dactylonectria estremocensis TaxID=1079267 RepID=A0A9P9IFZ5_9HYPO|nr:hypothetical protein B0J13DRAFT_599732 [Dactylonectria estremocensis]